MEHHHDESVILIVDDDQTNLNVIIDYLKMAGFKTITARNGEMGIKRAIFSQPDLILLDVMMPGIDGFETCRRLQAEPATKNIPILFMTALTDVDNKVKGFDMGGVDYITKPIEEKEVLARVDTHLRLKEANDVLKNQAEILEQKVQERTRQLLLTNQAFARFVPNEFLKALGQPNILDVKLGDHMQGDMTIMFSDIRSYTTLSETMTPQEVFNFTNGYHNRMTPIIRAHHGFVQQFQGDGVVSVFPGEPADGIQAAIAIQRKCEEYNRERTQKHRTPIRVGIGLHSGPLMVGIIGDTERWETGVPSDTVNTAVRMEGLTKYYGVSIIVSETSFAGLNDPDQYHYRFLDKVQVIGKTRAISIYEVFDADPEELFERKLSTKSLFEEGQHHYFAKDFAEAVKCFTDVLKVLPDDLTTKHYLERSATFLLEGVPDDWQGIRTIDKK